MPNKYLDAQGVKKIHDLVQEDIQEAVETKQDTLVSGTNIKTINGDSILGSGDLSLSVDHMTEILWADLKALRDTSELTPGMYYRITDYECTTTQANTSSAGHVFDIIMLATANNQLSEKCWAAHHINDEYFINNNLNQWQLWYCLDNDATRFEWADTTNGKGVIYRLIDELGNDLAYDFKNILYIKNNINYYTFQIKDNNIALDASITKTSECYANKILSYTVDNIQKLNKIYFNTTSNKLSCYLNTFNYNCHDSTFGSKTYNIKLGIGCYNFTCREYLNNISCGNNCYNISTYMNSHISMGNNCYGNNFDVNARNIFMGHSCYSNTFNTDSDNLFLGNNCYSNSFVQSDNIILGNSCYNNSFGYYCNGITIGNNCHHNRFSNECLGITFGNCCTNNTISQSYTYYCKFDDGCSYIKLLSDDSYTPTGGYNNLRYIHIHFGVIGTSSQIITISVPDRQLPYGFDYYPDGAQEVILGGSN